MYLAAPRPYVVLAATPPRYTWLLCRSRGWPAAGSVGSASAYGPKFGRIDVGYAGPIAHSRINQAGSLCTSRPLPL